MRVPRSAVILAGPTVTVGVNGGLLLKPSGPDSDHDALIQELNLKPSDSLAERSAKVSSPLAIEKEMHKYRTAVEKAKKQGEENLKHMTPDKALDILKSKMSGEAREKMSLLIRNASKKKAGSDEKAMFVKAVQALNSIQIDIEDQKVHTIVTCDIKLKSIMGAMLGYMSDAERADNDATRSERQINEKLGDIQEAEDAEREKLAVMAELTAAHMEDMRAEDELLQGLINEREVFQFIMMKAEEQCGGGPDGKGGAKEKAAKDDAGLVATSSDVILRGASQHSRTSLPLKVRGKKGSLPKKLLKKSTKKTFADKKARLQSELSNEARNLAEACRVRKSQNTNEVMLKIFGDAELMRRASQHLGFDAKKAMKKHIRSLRKAEKEKVAPKYEKAAFLEQRKSLPKKESSYNVLLQSLDNRQGPETTSDGSMTFPIGGSCDNQELDCDMMAVIIGQELQCRGTLVIQKENEINDKKAERQKETENSAKELKSIRDGKTAFESAVTKLRDLKDTLLMNKRSLLQLLHDTHKGFETERWECYLQIAELETNYYCATKNLRKYMKNLLLQAFGRTENDLRDCEYGMTLTPTGLCKIPGQTSEHLCHDEEMLPLDESQRGKQDFTRQTVEYNEISDEFYEELVAAVEGEPDINVNNTAITCEAYKTGDMLLTCNLHLCDRNCMLTEWSDWGGCSKACDGGSHSRHRKLVEPTNNGGRGTTQRGNGVCGVFHESQDCNTEPCDKDCELHEWTKRGSPLRACGQTVQVAVRKKKEDAVGRGTCPAQISEERIRKEEVLVDTAMQPTGQYACSGDETCKDTMDLVIALDASGVVGFLGLFMQTSFVTDLLKKVPSYAQGSKEPTTLVGIIVGGNGKAKKGPAPQPGELQTYVVQDAEILSALTDDITGYKEKLLNLVIDRMKNKSKLGFNNAAAALAAANDVLDLSPRKGSPGVVKQVLMIGKWNRLDCTTVVEEAAVVKGTAEAPGASIKVLLFDKAFMDDSSKFEPLLATASWPWEESIMAEPGLQYLHDSMYREQLVTRVIPFMCTDAVSPSLVRDEQCENGWVIVHDGMNCPNWTFALTTEPVQLPECRAAALAQGFKGFVYTDRTQAMMLAGAGSPGGSADTSAATPNCYTHEVDGKRPQQSSDEDKKPLDDTCTFAPEYDPDTPTGWMHTAVLGTSNDGSETSHYAVISPDDCDGVAFYKNFQFNREQFAEYNNMKEEEADEVLEELAVMETRSV